MIRFSTGDIITNHFDDTGGLRYCSEVEILGMFDWVEDIIDSILLVIVVEHYGDRFRKIYLAC